MRQSQPTDLREALKSAAEALSISTRFGFKDTAAHALVTLGNIYTNLGDLIQAEVRFTAAAVQYGDLGDKSGIALATGNLAEVLRVQKKYDRSLVQSARVLKLYEELKNPKGIANTSLSIGNVHVLQKRWPEAEAAYQNALATARSVGDTLRIGRALAGLGNVYLETDKLSESIANGQSAVKIFDALPSPLDGGCVGQSRPRPREEARVRCRVICTLTFTSNVRRAADSTR
jgi:tetratricopeptide (TPR) repeat protein